MSKVFFISDLHLGHRAIIKFRKGGFKSVDEHDWFLRDQWNKVVTERDIVFVLGDVAFSHSSLDLLKTFNGQKKLILGNHDKFQMNLYTRYFQTIMGAKSYKKKTILTHIPIHESSLEERFSLNIHGHQHGHKVCINYLSGSQEHPRYYNVAVDHLPLFQPVSWEKICEDRHL